MLLAQLIVRYNSYRHVYDPWVIMNFCGLFRDVNGNTALLTFGRALRRPVVTRDITSVALQLLDHGADIAIHNHEGQSFYSLFKKYTRAEHVPGELIQDIPDIQGIIQVPSLQCLSIHVVYPIRERIKHLPNVPS